MSPALAYIRSDCELQNNHVIQDDVVIFQLFCRSLRTEGPLLANYF